jgi:hypothetical protein
MAEQVQITDSPGTAKIRSPLGVAVLSVVTLGIYAIFWYYFINREMRDLGAAHNTDELGTSPGTSVLAVTLGAFIIVPAVISLINTFKRVQAAQRLGGGGEPINGWIGLILAIVISPALYAYEQSGLNKVWESGQVSQALPGGQQQIGTPGAAEAEKTDA